MSKMSLKIEILEVNLRICTWCWVLGSGLIFGYFSANVGVFLVILGLFFVNLSANFLVIFRLFFGHCWCFFGYFLAIFLLFFGYFSAVFC